MTKEERFIEEYKALCTKYGMKMERSAPPEECVCPWELDKNELRKYLSEIKSSS